jgi:hypothetical protein
LRPSTTAALLHALATAVAIDIRVMAIVLPVATLALLVVRPLRREASIAETIRVLAIYFAAVCVLVPAMWPWLWMDPIGHFAEAIKSMSHFRWDGEVLYLGHFIRSDALPWHYILVWILVTTPLLYLGLFLLGAIAILNRIARCGVRLWKSDEELQDIVFLGLFITPVIAVVALQSVLYDGWRHVYFVYPAFIFVAIGGWVTLWGWNRRTRYPRYLLGLATLISTIHIAVWMWRAHPFQNVYFNSFAGSNLKTRFELDYWGLANVKALKFILAHDPSEVVNVRAGSFMNIPIAFKMIDPKDRPRLRYSNDENTPHFLITNFRLVRDPDFINYSEYYEPVYQVLVGDEVILSVYRSRVEAPAHHVDHCQENWRLGRGYSCLFIP